MEASSEGGYIQPKEWLRKAQETKKEPSFGGLAPQRKLVLQSFVLSPIKSEVNIKFVNLAELLYIVFQLHIQRQIAPNKMAKGTPAMTKHDKRIK